LLDNEYLLHIFTQQNAVIICRDAGIDGGNDVDADVLRGIYERVRDCEFKPGSDHVSQVVRIEQMIVGKKPVCCTLRC